METKKKLGRPKGSKNLPKQFCIHGHDTFLVGRNKGGHCNTCNRINQHGYKSQHQEEIKQHYINNRDRILEKAKKYQREHLETRRLISLRQDEKRSKRIVSWDQDGIKEFYDSCPLEMEIDHRIPLCGKKVSGLHVLSNLQYLTELQNGLKSNKIDLVVISKHYGLLLQQLGFK